MYYMSNPSKSCRSQSPVLHIIGTVLHCTSSSSTDLCLGWDQKS
jgi:hypothetical protein